MGVTALIFPILFKGVRFAKAQVSGNRLGSGRRLRALARRPGPKRIVSNSSEELFKRPSHAVDCAQFFLDRRFQSKGIALGF